MLAITWLKLALKNTNLVYLNVEQAFLFALLSFIQWSLAPFRHQLTHAINIVLGCLNSFLKIMDHVSRLLNVFPRTFLQYMICKNSVITNIVFLASATLAQFNHTTKGEKDVLASK